MKLSISKPDNGNGYFITCHIGEEKYISWWKWPPKSVDHAELEYLKNRYPCISTMKRADKFKTLYRTLMQDGGIKYEV